MNGREIYTNYDAISKQMELGVWEDTMCLAQRNCTLDFYYRLYSLVMKYFPSKPHGYKREILFLRDSHNKLIISQMGGVRDYYGIYSQGRN